MWKTFVLAYVISLAILPWIQAGDAHKVEKRQVGVLARTGDLPHSGGKRSVAVLAREGALPRKGEKREAPNDNIMDDITEELAVAEGLSRLRLEALTERLLQLRQEEEDEAGNNYEDEEEKRSLSSLARVGALPIKRSMDALSRSGYLIKPVPEVNEQQRELLLDPEEFLGKDLEADKRGGVASLVRHGYVGKRSIDDGGDSLDYLLQSTDGENNDDKRNIGSARNFSGKRNIASAKNFNGKRNIGAARNFATDNLKRNLGAARNFITSSDDKRSLGSARNFLLAEDKRNIGAARNFFSSGMKKNLGSARNFFYGKRNIGSFARDGGFNSVRYASSKKNELPWDEDEDFDFDDFHDENKRYLGSLLRNQYAKRYIGALARSQMYPESGKRNLASFRNLGKRFDELEGAEDIAAIEKRETHSIQSKNTTTSHTRNKREIFDDNTTEEQPMPVFQNSKSNDYQELLASLSDNYNKRFLGRIPQLGRVHHKQQAPSGRRRPHLRPNWL